jgi:hypothetical protein
MSDVKTFLKILNKVGYPNPDTKSIAKMMGYDFFEFIPNLVYEIGEDGAQSFVNNALAKLSTEDGIKVDLSNGEYVYIIVDKAKIDIQPSGNDVSIVYRWGDSKLLSTDEEGNEVYKTLEQIDDDLGMGDQGDYDDMIDYIKDQFYQLVLNNCGFGIEDFR